MNLPSKNLRRLPGNLDGSINAVATMAIFRALIFVLHGRCLHTSSHLMQGVGENLWVEMCDSNCVYSKYLGSLSGTLIMIST